MVNASIEGFSNVEMSQLFELRNEKKLSLSGVSPTTILHQPFSIHLIPAGSAPIDSPLVLGIRCPTHDDSVTYLRIRCFIIQPSSASAAASNAKDPTF